MDARTALANVTGYSHRLGKTQAAHQHLQEVRRDPPPEFPLGLLVRVSGNAPSLPVIPWIALLDGDVTDTAKEGLYLVYLYTGSLDAVYLSMNQGATQHEERARARGLKGRAAEAAAIEEIHGETLQLRKHLDPALLSGTLSEIDLQARGFLPEGYEVGSIAALRYDLDSLPSNADLARDLEWFAQIYQQCIALKDSLAANQQLGTSSRSKKKRHVPPQRTPIFKPKDSSDYLANVRAATQRRERKHEDLIREFVEHVRAVGYVAANNVHPRDLVLHANGNEWLVEAKTVDTNAEPAVRDAIGQLFAYRHFYYRTQNKPDPQLLALFNAPIGEAFETLLTTLDIDYVCRAGNQWRGSPEGLKLLNQSP